MQTQNGHKGAKEYILFQSPHQSQKTYYEKKGRETWNNSKPKRTKLAYNHVVLQNKSGLHYLQNCQHLLSIEGL